MRRRKRYIKCWDRETGRTVLLHRKVAETMLGRSLLPGEIVHHRDGDSLNNTWDNLLVLPNQRYHAHFEYHLRCEKRGQPLLFPELLQVIREDRRGTLFEGILPG
ncbi:HNH endonuclease [Deinococcus aestuarii]|uniref:HNH endonuclease n=1 Tax=Deinococcus aestuarii TaxID=2774531 RepID=UPI001C0BF261|nr:HNH endonuclease [Deinococcus aestuarii]